MNLDWLVLTAAIITVVWCAFSCVFGVLVARSIDVASTRERARHVDDDSNPRHGVAQQ